MKFWKKIVISIAVGLLLGSVLGEKAHYLKGVGTLFLDLLNMLVVLLIFSSMTVGIISIRDFRKLGRVGLKGILFYAGTTAIAIFIGLFFAKLINPGKAVSLPHQNIPIQITEVPKISSLFSSLIPTNPVRSLADGDILQVIIFSIFLGLGINLAGKKGKPFARVMHSLSEVMLSMTGIVMSFAPYGICGIIAWICGTFGFDILFSLFKLVMTHYIACCFHMVLVFGGLLVFVIRVPILSFIKGMGDAITLAASTTSSSITLPATLHCTHKNLGVSKPLSHFLLPLGSTINMNGTAIFQAIAAVFISQVYAVNLSWYNLITIVVTATLSAVGCAGVPGAGIITLSIVLKSIGLPLEGVAIVMGIDRLRDIIGTVVNVLGDAVVCMYVAKTEGELDEKKCHSQVRVNYASSQEI